MMPGSIKIQDLCKSYRLYRRPADMLVEALTGRQRHEEFHALQAVSFEVEPGTVVGIMGRNGAGKSTLLRIIAGTLPATNGTVFTDGRMAAILELGSGFHPDYTGRENVELGGLCLGMSRAQIRQRFDDIVAFSELAEFIDRPFSTYSSGMQARLTFAVATCVEPDILIVDEALSVGDAKFQLKSFERIREFKRQGKSILLVSHSINQVVSICDRAILLERGRIYADGAPNRIGHVYHELLFGSPGISVEEEHDADNEADVILDINSEELPNAQREEAADNEPHGIALTAHEASPVISAEPIIEPVAANGPASKTVVPRWAPNDEEHRSVAEVDSGTMPQNTEGLAARKLNGQSELAPAVAHTDITGDRDQSIDRTPAEPMALTPQGEVTAQASGQTNTAGHRYGNGWARILNLHLEDMQGSRPVLVESGRTYRFVVEFIAKHRLPSLCIGFLIRTSWGIDLIGTDTRFMPCPGLPDQMMPHQRCRAVLELPLSFAPGTYFFTISIVGMDETKYDHWFDCLAFTVAPTTLQLYTTSLLGVPITSRAVLVERANKLADI